MRKFLDTYHIRDAREILSVLPDKEFVDTTITSPPYWNLKDYESRNQVGFGQKYDEYLDDLEKIFEAVYRVTKKTGSLWIVADTIKHNGELRLFPFDLAARLKRVGWVLHDIIVWHKDKTLPWSHRGKLRNIFEYVLFFSKGKKFKYYMSQVRETEGLKEWWMRYPERYSPQGKAPTRTWSVPIPRQGSWGANENWVRHFCPFPPELVHRMILLTTKTGDAVLDPFCGSGVVLAEAGALDRHYVGFDLRASYRRMFQTRVFPSVTKLEAQDSTGRMLEEKKRRAFSDVVWRLRKTKYPRELVRLYEQRYGRLGVRGVIALSPRPRSINITLILSSSKRTREHIRSRLRKLTSKPPLSKYGLKVKVQVTSKPGLLGKKTKGKSTLNLYENGKTYYASRVLSARGFLESLDASENHRQDGLPPIASDVRVRISNRVIRQKSN